MATGPCSWPVLFNDCCDCWDTLDPAERERALRIATTVIWAGSGKQFDACPQTVRPCGRTCDSNASGWIYNDGLFSPWLPYIFNGAWRNCWCGCGPTGGPGCCTCEPSQQVYLPGPVTSITSVIQDGVLVDPDDYRVDNRTWLVRTTGEWPECQNFDLDAGLGLFNANTLVVTYVRGEPVPQALLDVAAVYACEVAKACKGSSCRLPGRVSTIARQGVQITNVNIDQFLTRGFTGIPEVDLVLRSYNPAGLPRPMRIWSPELPIQREVTTA